MKTFIYTKTEKKASYGTNVTLHIYQIKNNVPKYIGDAHFNTGSTRGEDHEAANTLLKCKMINRNSLDTGGYINRNVFDTQYRLIRL